MAREIIISPLHPGVQGKRLRPGGVGWWKRGNVFWRQFVKPYEQYLELLVPAVVSFWKGILELKASRRYPLCRPPFWISARGRSVFSHSLYSLAAQLHAVSGLKIMGNWARIEPGFCWRKQEPNRLWHDHDQPQAYSWRARATLRFQFPLCKYPRLVSKQRRAGKAGRDPKLFARERRLIIRITTDLIWNHIRACGNRNRSFNSSILDSFPRVFQLLLILGNITKSHWSEEWKVKHSFQAISRCDVVAS
jgi:hypothetical protein